MQSGIRASLFKISAVLNNRHQNTEKFSGLHDVNSNGKTPQLQRDVGIRTEPECQELNTDTL
jgi:hypothetical protein